MGEKRGVTMQALLITGLLFALTGQADSLESPADAAINVGVYPDLLWSESAWGGIGEAAYYQVQIAADSNFAAVVAADTVEIARYVPCDHPLECGETYYWRVRCQDSSFAAGSWSEVRNFTVVDYDNYVVEIDAADDNDAVLAAFADAKAHAPATVRLVEDVTWASTNMDVVYLSWYKNIRFDGAGHSITVTNPANRLFQVLNSENCLFENFSVDYNPLPYVLCEVTGLDTVNDRLTMVTISNAANPCLELNHPLMVDAPKTHMRLVDKNNPGAVMPGATTYILDGKQWYLNSYTNSGTVYHVIQLDGNDYTADQFLVGDYMLRVARGDALNTIRSAVSERICVNNVTAYASPSQFVSSIDGSEFMVLNCNVTLKDGRYSSITADSVYVRRNEIGPWVQNCSFVGNGDDCMNFHSLGASIASKVSSNVLEMTALRTLTLCDIGDEVVIWDPRPGTNPAIYTTVTDKDTEALTMTFADDVGTINFGDANGFDSVVYTIDKANKRFYVKDNYVKNNARFGLLVSSQGGAAVGNVFESCGSSAIRIGNTPDEGLCTTDFLVQSNRMVGCGYVNGFFEIDGGVVTMNSYAAGWADSPHQFHLGVQLVGNRIEQWNQCAFNLKGAGDVLLDNNVITDGGLTNFIALSTTNDLFRFGNLTGVTLKNTAVSDSRSYDQDLCDLGNLLSTDLNTSFNSSLPEEGPGNLLNEGSFEDSGNGWILNSASVVNSNAVEGASCMELAGDVTTKSEYVIASGCTTYTLSGWIKADNVTSSSQGVRFDIREYRRDGGGATRINSVAWQTGTFGWTRFELTFTTRPDTGKIQVYCVTLGLTDGTAWFDDMQLTRGEPNLLVNGSFDHDLSGWSAASQFSWNGALSQDNSSGCLQVTETSDTACMAYQYIDDIEAGADYVLTGSIKIPEDLTGSGTGAKLVLKFYNGSEYLGFHRGGLYTSAMDWTDDTVTTYTAPATATRAKVEAYLHTNSGTVYYDCLKLRKVE